MTTNNEIEIILTNLRQALRALEERTGPLHMMIWKNGILAVCVDDGHGLRWQPLYRTEST